MFNTLKYAKILEDVGFSRDQSETAIRVLVDIMEDKFATKQDLLIMKQDLVIKIGAMLATSVGLIVALVKLL